MSTYKSVLKHYWGYDEFRALQLDIISSVGAGEDTLGLMPTGGGKSLTFQVPTMATEGLCLVVTPLIALMKDQVQNLVDRGIKAAAIYSGMDNREIIRLLDNCIYGDFKFLYLSPERLSTEAFLNRLPHLPVCMIAVDESHCISQWGYDFRPSYLKIADIRKFLPSVPVLALTATATPEVVVDIQERLLFPKKNVFQKSFYRGNLAYVVRQTENKLDYLLRILANVQGTSVVYVRNRKKTKEIAEFLVQNGITAEHFHAGLSNLDKDARQHRWKRGETRVMVATNAFGMGIDKAEVRTVVHLDLPDTLEAYYQEAGRAGRDEQKAYCVLLYNNTDAVKVKKRIADSFPEPDFIRRVYEAVCNYKQVGIGSGLDNVFQFDIGDFCTKYKLPILPTFSALKILQQAGYVELTDDQESSTRIRFAVHKDELYNYRYTPLQENIIYLLLRSYTGIFTDFAYINEEQFAARAGISRAQLCEEFLNLSRMHVVAYIPRTQTPYLFFTSEREATARVELGRAVYADKKERYVRKIEAVLAYAQESMECRSQVLLRYFGENDSHPCEQCDICLRKKEESLNSEEYAKISNEIVTVLAEEPLHLTALLAKLKGNKERCAEVIRFMQDQGLLVLNERLHYYVKNKD